MVAYTQTADAKINSVHVLPNRKGVEVHLHTYFVHNTNRTLVDEFCMLLLNSDDA